MNQKVSEVSNKNVYVGVKTPSPHLCPQNRDNRNRADQIRNSSETKDQPTLFIPGNATRKSTHKMRTKQGTIGAETNKTRAVTTRIGHLFNSRINRRGNGRRDWHHRHSRELDWSTAPRGMVCFESFDHHEKAGIVVSRMAVVPISAPIPSSFY